MIRIETSDVSKTIGDVKVLEDINLELTGGNIYGFCGPNGSEKTMLLRAISGLIKTEGKISIFGEKIRIGLLIENIGLYPDLSIYDNLKLLAGINKLIGKDKIKESIKYVGLDPNDKRPIKKYSLGMKQRAALAQAIMEEPNILMLYEPTNALDDMGMAIVRKEITRLKENGALIIISSHNKDDLSVCDKIFKFRNGKVNADEI